MSRKLFYVVLTASCFLIGCSGGDDSIRQLENTINEQHLKIVVLYILIPVASLIGIFIGTAVGAKARRDFEKEKENGKDE